MTYDEVRQLMDAILIRAPEASIIRGFEEAPDEVLRLFVALASDRQYEKHRILVPRVEALLTYRVARKQEQDRRLANKGYKVTLVVLGVSIAGVLVGLLAWLAR